MKGTQRKKSHLILTPLFEIYWETFLETHSSAALRLVAIVASKSFGIPTITSTPVLPRALIEPGSASNSFTFWNPLSLSSLTTVVGGRGWLVWVPQLAPIPLTEPSTQKHETTAAANNAENHLISLPFKIHLKLQYQKWKRGGLNPTRGASWTEGKRVGRVPLSLKTTQNYSRTPKQLTDLKHKENWELVCDWSGVVEVM